ncbi:MAG: FapA family protein [Desulfobulbaceae bacterium]|nr:FapA family protein [Desulfobulbaceae bacterium]
MRKISITDVETGMVIAADVFDQDFGSDLPLLGRGVTLTEKYITKMKERGLDEILIVTPPDYRGAPGETLALLEVKDDIVSEGNLELQCDIPPGTKIAASENIFIEGIVNQGCSVISAQGDIVIKGGIIGCDDHRVMINAGKRVTISNNTDSPVICADIKALEEINAKGDMDKCSLSAKGRLFVDGKTVESNIYSHTRIRLKECGNSSGTPCRLLIKPAECRELFQKLLALDKQLAQLKKDKDRLHNSINLVRSICKDIDSLPQDKKMELALDVKNFKEADNKIACGAKAKEQLKDKVVTALEAQRIFIDNVISPPTQITIENCSLCLDDPLHSVAFYVQDMKVRNTSLR